MANINLPVWTFIPMVWDTLNCKGMDQLNKRVWINSRRHWRSTLYVNLHLFLHTWLFFSERIKHTMVRAISQFFGKNLWKTYCTDIQTTTRQFGSVCLHLMALIKLITDAKRTLGWDNFYRSIFLSMQLRFYMKFLQFFIITR